MMVLEHPRRYKSLAVFTDLNTRKMWGAWVSGRWVIYTEILLQKAYGEPSFKTISLRHSHFCDSKRTTNCSFAWRAMVQVRHHVKENCCWSVGKGSQISIWHDPWLPSLNNSRFLNSTTKCVEVNKVEDLMIPGQWKWNSEIIDHVFAANEARVIKDVPLSCHEDFSEDKLIWMQQHPNGIFSAKSFLKQSRTSLPSSSSLHSDTSPGKSYGRSKTLPQRFACPCGG